MSLLFVGLMHREDHGLEDFYAGFVVVRNWIPSSFFQHYMNLQLCPSRYNINTVYRRLLPYFPYRPETQQQHSLPPRVYKTPAPLSTAVRR